MKKLIVGFVLMLCGAALAASPASQQAELLLPLYGTIEIGPDGKVRDYEITTPLKPMIAEAVDRSIRSWQFDPIRVNGRLVIARSNMRLTLQAEEVDAGYTLTIRDVSFGAAQPDEATSRRHHVSYPKDALLERLGANVLLVVRIDEQGQVTDLHPYQTNLSLPFRGNRAARWRRIFEHASIDAIKRWTFKPGEVIDGQPAANTFVYSMEFRIVQGSPPATRGRRDRAVRDSAAQWRPYYPGPITPAPWIQVNASAEQLASLKENETLALSSSLRLQTDVIGRGL